MPLTDKQKQARRRAKMRSEGFKEILVKVHQDDIEKVREYVKRLERMRN